MRIYFVWDECDVDVELKMCVSEFKFQKWVEKFKGKSIGEFTKVWVRVKLIYFGRYFTYALTNISKRDKKKK